MQNNYKQLLKKLIRCSVLGIVIQCFVFAPFFASAAVPQQEVTITGQVTSSGDGDNLPGVNVVIKGTTQGTTTDADGRYTIKVPSANTTLVFSFIGYTAQEVVIGAQTVVNVALLADIQQLNEVV